MLGWLALGTLLAYVGVLFALGHLRPTVARAFEGPRARRMVYGLGCCVFCGYSSCFGVIGLSGGRGAAVLLLWLSPVVIFSFGSPIIARMTEFARARQITSIADFIASQFGGTTPMSALVALTALVFAMPFMAMLLDAITLSLSVAIGDPDDPAMRLVARHLGLLVAILTMVFTIGLGARHLGPSDRQKGLALVVATECFVKLAAFVTIAVYVTWGEFHGVADLARSAAQNLQARVEIPSPPSAAIVAIVIANGLCLLFEPSQFHMTVLAETDAGRIRASRWIVPLFCVVMALSTVPIMVASFTLFPGRALDLDIYMVAFPARAHANALTLIALIGGFAATMSLLAVSGTALAIMVSNDLAMPILLHPWLNHWSLDRAVSSAAILTLRRIVIVVLLALAYAFSRLLDESALATAALGALVLFAQIAPASLIALAWPGATKRAALAGVAAGVLAALVVPGAPILASMVRHFAIAWPRPTAVFGVSMEPFAQVLFWSLAANLLAFGLCELTSWAWRAARAVPEPGGSEQRSTCAPCPVVSVTVGDLKATVVHYLGSERGRRAFEAYGAERGAPFDPAREADDQDLRFGETLLTSAIGAASSRLVVSLLLKRRAMSRDEVLRLVDDVSAEIQDNRDILIEAIARAQQGMAFYDRHLRLVAWNKAFATIFMLPETVARLGTPLVELVRLAAQRGIYGVGAIDDLVAGRMAAILDTTTIKRTRGIDGDAIFDLRSVRMPDGGLFVIYTDVTEQAVAEEQLEAENERLERRVRERTEQLERLNAALVKAKAEAEQANISKTRFLAAASHDLLQPLNAARLYATSLKERVRGLAPGDDSLSLALNVEGSLEAVEDILTALLDISRLDAGATKPEITDFSLRDILRQLRVEFEPTAKAKGLAVTFVASSLRVRSDRRLLRRLLRNLISNAIKYTEKGRVIVGARREGGRARIEVWDTGMGIPKSKQRDIFKEFERLPSAVATAPGVGLGLSIVERLSRILGHEIRVRSKPGEGSVFSVVAPRAEPAPVAWITLGWRAGFRLRSLEGLVIAVIDNEPTILKAMEALLGGWDCHAVGGVDVPSLEAALRARDVAPDVIIADYHLGEGDGIAAIAELRRRHGPCHAVLVTADRDPSLRDIASLEDIRVLNKPVKPAALRSLLSQWRLVKQIAE
jgi:signal transduction histidine kinase/Na+/proline symporter